MVEEEEFINSEVVDKATEDTIQYVRDSTLDKELPDFEKVLKQKAAILKTLRTSALREQYEDVLRKMKKYGSELETKNIVLGTRKRTSDIATAIYSQAVDNLDMVDARIERLKGRTSIFDAWKDREALTGSIEQFREMITKLAEGGDSVMETIMKAIEGEAIDAGGTEEEAGKSLTEKGVNESQKLLEKIHKVSKL